MHHVILGAGPAGVIAAETIRKHAPHDTITLVGDEPAPPYQRPPLSKAYLKGEMDAERLFLKPLAYYAEHRIDLVTGDAAAALADAQTHPHALAVSVLDGIIKAFLYDSDQNKFLVFF